MLKFDTLCAVLAYLSSNLLNEVGLSLFRYFEVGLRVCDIVVKNFTFAISSPDEFLYVFADECVVACNLYCFFHCYMLPFDVMKNNKANNEVTMPPNNFGGAIRVLAMPQKYLFFARFCFFFFCYAPKDLAPFSYIYPSKPFFNDKV